MRPVRTQSGVTPVTVLTKPYPCPGECIFCPNDVRMPKSYLSDEPGAQRAEDNYVRSLPPDLEPAGGLPRHRAPDRQGRAHHPRRDLVVPSRGLPDLVREALLRRDERLRWRRRSPHRRRRSPRPDSGRPRPSTVAGRRAAGYNRSIGDASLRTEFRASAALLGDGELVRARAGAAGERVGGVSQRGAHGRDAARSHLGGGGAAHPPPRRHQGADRRPEPLGPRARVEPARATTSPRRDERLRLLPSGGLQDPRPLDAEPARAPLPRPTRRTSRACSTTPTSAPTSSRSIPAA